MKTEGDKVFILEIIDAGKEAGSKKIASETNNCYIISLCSGKRSLSKTKLS